MTKPTTDQAPASPTKRFFVSMLTCDINLADAILDLLDNCLDGALRLADGSDVDYAKHFMKSEIAADHFSIEDNCGSIPRDVAKNYAFKMGREALVRTRYGNDTFEVPITSAWLDAKGWEPLPINEPTEADEKLAEPGTVIRVNELYEGASRLFANEAFENEVRTAIAEHFTMFLQQGLKVDLNGKPVEPVFVVEARGGEGNTQLPRPACHVGAGYALRRWTGHGDGGVRGVRRRRYSHRTAREGMGVPFDAGRTAPTRPTRTFDTGALDDEVERRREGENGP